MAARHMPSGRPHTPERAQGTHQSRLCTTKAPRGVQAKGRNGAGAGGAHDCGKAHTFPAARSAGAFMFQEGCS